MVGRLCADQRDPWQYRYRAPHNREEEEILRVAAAPCTRAPRADQRNPWQYRYRAPHNREEEEILRVAAAPCRYLA